MKVVLATKEDLTHLYNTSALMVEGVSECGIPKFYDWLRSKTALKKDILYQIKGKTLNETYNLTGRRAYNDNVNIIAVPLTVIYDRQSIANSKYEINARWFNDVVDGLKTDVTG